MHVIFMGSPEIAVPSLLALSQAGHEILGVVTQPDRPGGRGQVLISPPVKQVALQQGWKVLQPKKIRSPEALEKIQTLHPDVICVVAYGQILPQKLLDLPPYGCVNLHFSLLPKYRGASCVAHPLIHGEAETGTTTILMDTGIDTGPILLQWSEPIRPEDTSQTLSERLAKLGADQMVKTLQVLSDETIQPTPQSTEGASYAPMLKKEEGRVDWSQDSASIYNRFRGLTPWPGVFTFFHSKRILLTGMQLGSFHSSERPGALHFEKDGKVWVECGKGTIELLRVKPEGKNDLPARIL
jgi:methionyl-tRNA formyltransferase